MALDISGLFFFMPIFSFLFVFLIVYVILDKIKLFGGSKFIPVFVSLIMAIIFMSFSSLELYVRTIIPWFITLFVIVFLVLMVAGFSTKSLDKIMTPAFAWVVVGILLLIFLVSAIKVFNPIFHPDLIISGGSSGPGIVQQVKDFIDSSKWMGSIILLIIASLVAWVLTKK